VQRAPRYLSRVASVTSVTVLAASMAVTIFEMHRSKMLLTRDEYLAILRAEGVVKTVKLVDAAIEKHCGKFA